MIELLNFKEDNLIQNEYKYYYVIKKTHNSGDSENRHNF